LDYHPAIRFTFFPFFLSKKMSASTISEIIEKSEFSLSSIELAKKLDEQDQFAQYRDEFVIPTRRSVSGENPVSGK
jgi:hypothetical protein